jgi:hypothetical protein
MFRRSVQIAVLSLIVLALSVGTAATVQRQRKRTAREPLRPAAAQPPGIPIVTLGTDNLVIRLSDAGRGVLHVEADANLPGSRVRNQKVWWCVEIRDSVFAAANTRVHEYAHQVFLMPKGQGATPTFADDFVVERGSYNVLVGVKTDTPYRRPDGTLEPFGYAHARSAWVDVK